LEPGSRVYSEQTRPKEETWLEKTSVPRGGLCLRNGGGAGGKGGQDLE